MTVTLTRIPLDRIHFHERNIRAGLGDLTELADSIRSTGVLEPIIVALHADKPGEYVIIAGHRRTEAAGLAGLVDIDAIVRADLDTPAAQLEAMLVENLHRADLTPIEEATGYQQLEILGYKPTRIAKATGRSRATVDRRLALMRLPESTRHRIHAGQISLGDAEAMLDFAGRPAALAKLEKAAGTSDWTWTLAGERRHAENVKAVERSRAELATTGVKVIDTPAEWSWGSTEQPIACIANPDAGDPDSAYYTADTHAGCPHHAAVVLDDGHVIYACTNPAVHGHPDWAAEADGHDTAHAEADTQRQANWEAEQVLRADLDTALAVRREFLTELLTPARKPARAQLTEMLRRVLTEQLEYVDASGFLPLLGHPLADDGDQAAEQLAEFADRIPNLGLEQCVQTLYACTDGVAGPHLVTPHQWAYDGASGYLEHLGRLGYQPTDVETRMLAQWAPAENPDAGEPGKSG